MVVELAPREVGKVARRLTRRQVWTALILYLVAFWAMVAYAVYDIFAR